MARPPNRQRRKRRKSWLGRILFWSACVVVVLAVAVAMAAPWILRAAVPEAFARMGLQATVSGGSLSLVRREVTLEGFVLGAPQAPALSFGELGLGLGVRALLAGRIKLRHLRVRDIDMNVERLLALREQLGTGAGPGRDGLPLELDELAVEDIRLAHASERLGHDVRVAWLKVSDPSALVQQRPSGVSLRGSIGEGNVDLQVEVDIDDGLLEVTGTYHIDDVPLRGWARLVSEVDDPLSAGAVNGRGDVRSEFVFESGKLDLVLDGWIGVVDLAADTASLLAERGDGQWRGRFALGWSPDMVEPDLRGAGSLEVDGLQLTIGRSTPEPVRAVIDDVSWHGDFHFRNGLRAEGAVLGTAVDVSDASPAQAAWRTLVEDFSWRLNASIGTRPEAFGLRLKDFDLARLSVAVTKDGTPLDIVAEKLALDELRSTQSGNLMLGRATMDTLAVTRAGGAENAGGLTIGVNEITVNGMNGHTSGTLHAVDVSAESLDYADADRSLRAEAIGFAGVGLGDYRWLSTDELSVESARLDEGRGDIWLSDLSAVNMHGDADGRFGAEALEIAQAFQVGSAAISWEASDLRLHGIDGDADVAANISAMNLGELRVGTEEIYWQSSGLRSNGVVIKVSGDVDVTRLGFDSLERRQPSIGNVRLSKLDGRGLRSRDGSAELERVAIADLDYRSPDGLEIAAHILEARAFSSDPVKGLELEHLSVGNGEGRDLQGANLQAAGLESSGLSVASNGSITIDAMRLARFSRTASGSAKLGLEGLDVGSLAWAPDGELSLADAALRSARLARPDEPTWALLEMRSANVVWDGKSHIGADRLALASLNQMHGETRDWRVQSLEAGGLELTLPSDVAVAKVTARSIDGDIGSVAWNVASVAVEALSSSESTGQRVDRLSSGAIAVSDEDNGAVLELERIRAQSVEISVLNELAARQLIVGGVRLGSDDPEWASRVSMVELRMDEPSLRVGGIVELEEVVARNPYLVVGQSADNVWMLPPLPGGGAGAGDDFPGRATRGIRVGRFSTRGPGRVVYIDRATEPVFRLPLDPLVAAIENLDTTLPGNRSRFRVRATGRQLAGLSLQGDVITGVRGFDLELEARVTGADLPGLNPYITEYGLIPVTRGWGDADTELTIEAGQLTGQVDLLMSGLELKSAGDVELKGAVDDSVVGGDTPDNAKLRASLALLKDRQGNIRLSIPLQAQTEDPDYDFIGTLKQGLVGTVLGAGKVAGTVSGFALDGVLKLLETTVSVLPGVDTTRYPPIEFDPGEEDIGAIRLVYLNQLADRMLEYDSLVLALCGRSVSADAESAVAKTSTIDTLFTQASEGVYRLYDPQPESMLALAGARAEKVGRYLRDLRRVPKVQAPPCDAAFDATPGAKPRVELDVKSRPRRGLFGVLP
jgi:hypothetical protein